jgi:hypothetical protein
LLRLPPRFAASLFGDMLLKPFRKKGTGPKSFSSILYDGLGPTISESFYFPYVKKLWGLDPDKLAVTLAERRVSSGSVGKILGKMIRMLPGMKGPTTGRFYYPRKGFGQISNAMVEASGKAGADYAFNANVLRIERDGTKVTGVVTQGPEGEVRHAADQVYSTIPLTAALRLMDPPAPEHVQKAAASIRFRGMILVYLILKTDQFTEYDAHYFPELSIPISRMSEPKNYNSAKGPKGLTIFAPSCPAIRAKSWWSMSDEELGKHYVQWLNDLGLPVKCEVLRCETRRIGRPILSMIWTIRSTSRRSTTGFRRLRGSCRSVGKGSLRTTIRTTPSRWPTPRQTCSGQMDRSTGRPGRHTGRNLNITAWRTEAGSGHRHSDVSLHLGSGWSNVHCSGRICHADAGAVGKQGAGPHAR